MRVRTHNTLTLSSHLWWYTIDLWLPTRFCWLQHVSITPDVPSLAVAVATTSSHARHSAIKAIENYKHNLLFYINILDISRIIRETEMQLPTRIHENRTKTFLQISIPTRETEAIPFSLHTNTDPSPIIMPSYHDGQRGGRHPKAGGFDLHTSSLIDPLTHSTLIYSSVLRGNMLLSVYRDKVL